MREQDEQHGLSPAQQELERALRSVAPAGARVDPLAAAFEAGRHSGRRPLRFWRVLAIVAFLAAAGPRLVPVRQGSDHGRGGLVDPSGSVVALKPAPAPAPRFSDQSVLMLQQTLRRQGVLDGRAMDGLPDAPLPPVRLIRAGDTL